MKNSITIIRSKAALIIAATALALALLSLSRALGADQQPSTQETNVLTRLGNNLVSPWKAKGEALYKDKELTLDIGGSYTVAEPNGFDHLFDTDASDGVWGVTLGSTYWPRKYIGFGFDVGITDVNNVESWVIDHSTFTLALRLPIGPVAPYALGGIGRDFGDAFYYSTAGVGAQYRFTPRVGLFIEGRYIWRIEEFADTLQFRGGLQWAF